jgi:orotate phosphoribosyltransferase
MILALMVFAICLAGVLFIMYKYEDKFSYPLNKMLVDLISKNQAFYPLIPPEPAEHREQPLFYKIELARIFERGFQMDLSKLMAYFIKSSNVNFDRMIGTEIRKALDQSSIEKYSFVPILSGIMKKPYAIIVEKKVEHAGSKRSICEGEIKEGEKVIIIDDVLTTGESIIRAAAYLRENYKNIKVTHAFAFVARYPYDEGGLKGAKKRFSNYGIELHAIVDNINLVTKLYEKKYITLEQLRYISNDKDLQGSAVCQINAPS